MDLVNKFYQKILKNLNFNITFIKEDGKNYSYSDIYEFHNILQSQISKLIKTNKQVRICILTEKSFRMSALVSSSIF